MKERKAKARTKAAAGFSTAAQKRAFGRDDRIGGLGSWGGMGEQQILRDAQDDKF